MTRDFRGEPLFRISIARNLTLNVPIIAIGLDVIG